jgi:hypothetical protein
MLSLAVLTHLTVPLELRALINQALREHMESKREPLEETLRRVLREELPGYGKTKKKAVR